MKRADNLFEQITDLNNLEFAYLKALKGKRYTPEVLIYAKRIDENLFNLKIQLENETYNHGKYRQFKIYDPKERLITAASFEDRIIHHAIMNILEPVFEKQFVFHTYACRKNKGTHRAVEYASKKAKQCEYFLKLDVRKYFDNVNHDVLKIKLHRILKDEKCLRLLFSIIDSFGDDNKQLPIGNLTSQFFANFYLSFDELLLTFKQPVINKCVNGIPFLGFLIKRNSISILSKNWKRKIRKLKQMDKESCKVNDSDLYNRYSNMFNC